MSEVLTERPLPAGFRAAASESGLVVPEALSREREAWCRDEWRLIDRVLKLMRSRNLAVVLHCNDPRCKGAELKVKHNEPVNGFTWECEHKARIFHRQV